MCGNAAINVMPKGGSQDRVGGVDFDEKQKFRGKLSNLWAKISIQSSLTWEKVLSSKLSTRPRISSRLKEYVTRHSSYCSSERQQ